jgi:hypothetical protein
VVGYATYQFTVVPAVDWSEFPARFGYAPVLVQFEVTVGGSRFAVRGLPVCTVYLVPAGSALRACRLFCSWLWLFDGLRGPV